MKSNNNKWVLDVQSDIYSKVKAVLTAKLKPTYKDLFITDDDEVPADPKFPAVYLKFLQPAERGKDLEGTAINGIYLTIEVKVTATKTQGMIVAKDVAYTVLEVMKAMSFDTTMPAFDNSGDGTKIMIARYSRVIGYNDEIQLNIG